MSFKSRFHFPNISALRKRIIHQWIKRYKVLFFILFLIVSALGGIQWYLNLNRYVWTAEEKKVFLERTIKETVFQEEQYRNVLKDLEDLALEHAASHELSRDLFIGKKEKKQ